MKFDIRNLNDVVQMTINDNDNDCEKKKNIPRNRFALLKETVKKIAFFDDSTVSICENDTLAARSSLYSVLSTLGDLIFPFHSWKH